MSRIQTPMGGIRKLAAVSAAAGLILLSNAAIAPSALAATASGLPALATDGTSVPVPQAVNPNEASTEAALVAAEDRRLIQVRAVTAVAPLHGTQWKSPYRLATGSGYTLILTARTAPYTVADLLALAPTTFLHQSDGSYLLLENIYVARGAALHLSAAGGLTLKLVTNANGFVSIVSYGGDLKLAGTADAPIKITSWDPRTAQPVTDLSHGRAYIRAIGGTFEMSYAQISDLGFWSGRTGGIGLTGTARAASGATSGPSVYSKGKKGGGSKTKNGTSAATPGDNLGDNTVTSSQAGALGNPDSEFTVPGLSYVSARIDHSVLTGNAFGLFISGATGIVVSDTQISGSLIAGLELHRFATQAVIQRVVSNQNYGDGIVVARAAQQVQISDSTASYNAGNGFTFNGQAISQGPSASGQALGNYGNNVLIHSTAQGNAHYGVQVLGGLNIAVDDNKISGSQMGIVVRRGAEKVTIAGNVLTQQGREGISIRDGVQAVTISGNKIQDAAAGIYVRASTAKIVDNTVSGATIHGITLVGADAGSVVNGNKLSGWGPGAINSSRVTGKIAIGSNDTGGWFDTTATWVRIKALIRPLTIVWFCIFVLIAITAIKGRRTRTGRGKRHMARRARTALGVHPYADQRRLATAIISVDRARNAAATQVAAETVPDTTATLTATKPAEAVVPAARSGENPAAAPQPAGMRERGREWTPYSEQGIADHQQTQFIAHVKDDKDTETARQW